MVDGDTLRHQGELVRIAGIDAPEIRDYKCPAELALGKRATDRLLVLINEGPFELVRTGRDEDKYGRKLREIVRSGRSLGDALIAEGLARPSTGARRGWCG
ncbi:SPBc2 prophage-derived endonuclease YokF precursor [compost metagenome]